MQIHVSFLRHYGLSCTNYVTQIKNVGASRKNVKQMLALRARMVVKNVKIFKKLKKFNKISRFTQSA